MNRTRPRKHRRFHLERLEDRLALSAGMGALGVDTSSYASDRILITLEDTGPKVPVSLLSQSPLAAGVESLGFGIYSVSLASGTSIDQAREFFKGLGGVVDAEPDYTVSVQRTPNDPQFGSLYGMSKISAPAAWDSQTGTGGTIVAVIDTGVDYNHPDLAANMWRNTREVAGNSIDDDGNGYVDDIFGYDFANNDANPFDDHGHGTHVAGTIGAVGNNGVGVVGVAWNTKIMALKFLTGAGSGSTSDAVRALDYAIRNGAKISNNSWGGGGVTSSLTAAIQRAQAAGHIVVVAAGNSNANGDVTPSYPAAYSRTYDNVVSVAATDSNDNRASFSNYGVETSTLAAPGVGILSTLPGGRYGSMSGTSMAAPHVAGALALIWDQNPDLVYQQVVTRLKSTVDYLPQLIGIVGKGGRLNVDKLVDSAGNNSPPPADTTGPSITASTFPGATDTTFNQVRVTFSEAIDATTFSASDVSILSPGGQSVAVSAISAVAGSSGTQFDITLGAQTAPGLYSITIGPNIADGAGNLMDQNGNGTKGEATADQYALTRTIVAPPTDTAGARVTAGAVFGSQAGTFNRVRLTFSETIYAPSFTSSDVVLTTPNGQSVTITAVTAVSGTNATQFDITFASQSAVGNYALAVGPNVLDKAGNPMNQDGDSINGSSGDRYLATITLSAPTDRAGAYVSSSAFFGSSTNTINRLRIGFSEAIDPTSFTAADVVLTNPFNQRITITGVTAVAGSGNKQFDITFSTQTLAGFYVATIGPGILDLAGNPMNQDRDGINGETSADRFSTLTRLNGLGFGGLSLASSLEPAPALSRSATSAQTITPALVMLYPTTIGGENSFPGATTLVTPRRGVPTRPATFWQRTV